MLERDLQTVFRGTDASEIYTGSFKATRLNLTATLIFIASSASLKGIE